MGHEQAIVTKEDHADALARIDEFDIVHLHGIWPPFYHRFVIAARKRQIPIVWSIHGMLSPWAMKYKRWKKIPAWWLWQKRDLKSAAVLHVTSGREIEWVRAQGFTNRIVNIPLGTKLPDAVPARAHKPKRLLFVGRVSPIKALDNLIRAWDLVRPADWTLRIVGNDERGYQANLVRLVEELKLGARVEFPGPKFGTDLEEEYQNADALVLPSHTENFGAVVADALAWGLPVITSKGTPWREVKGEKEVVVGSGTVEFVNLEPGDTFDQIEQYLRQRVAVTFENKTLGISASIGSKRNANELAKHMAAGESPEAHKFAAKNIGALFERGVVGFTHLDKKATPNQRWITRFVRVVSSFYFAGERFVATLTLKAESAGGRLYAVEAVEINQDVKFRSTPRGAISKDLNSAPILNLTSQLAERIAYYVGDVNRTHPAFLGCSELFSIERAADLICASVSAPSGALPSGGSDRVAEILSDGATGPSPLADAEHSTRGPVSGTIGNVEASCCRSRSACGWWVENDPENLAKALRELMAISDEDRRAMGARGRKLAGEKYSWAAVAGQVKNIYNLVRGGS